MILWIFRYHVIQWHALVRFPLSVPWLVYERVNVSPLLVHHWDLALFINYPHISAAVEYVSCPQDLF